VLLAVAMGALVAFGVRALGWEQVFPGEGRVVFRIGDGHSHARRAIVSFLRFPGLLVFDPYLNYPDGAPVPTPPLYNFSVAAAARLLGSSVGVFEHVQAWASPVLGSLAVVPVALAARGVAGPAAAAGAAALYALFPVIALSSRVGDADHHAAVSLVGAWQLAILLSLVRSDRRRLFALGVALTAARLAMLLTWGGSLGYAGTLDAAILAAGALTGRRPLLATEAASALATGALLLPVVAALPTPSWGAWSPGALSYLQVAFSFAVAGAAALVLAGERWRPAGSAAARVGRLVAACALCAVVLLAHPAARAGLLEGLSFLRTPSFAPGSAVAELLPLFPIFGRPVLQPPQQSLGWLAYGVPLVPPVLLWIAWRDPSRRAPALVLAWWTGLFGALFVSQYRFGTEYAAGGAVAFAWIGRELAGAARRRLGLSNATLGLVAALLGVVLLWPALATYGLLARASLASLGSDASPRQRMLATPAGSLVLFLEQVRAATPETAGWLGDGVPEYGILCPPNLGHALQFVAHRASPASGYFTMLGTENLLATRAFFDATREGPALEIARRLRSRYVLTAAFPGSRPGSMALRLQRADGTAAFDLPRLVHFRLVAEGPRGGSPLGDLLGLPRSPRVVPYKLFEIVPGALLRVPGEPGAPVRAAVDVQTSDGRRFAYVARATAGDDGFASLRVPYATDAGYPAGPTGPYRVRSGDRSYEVSVADRDVLAGATVAVGAGDAALPAPAAAAGGPASGAVAVDTQPASGSPLGFARVSDPGGAGSGAR
jgi:hypothetical protein